MTSMMHVVRGAMIEKKLQEITKAKEYDAMGDEERSNFNVNSGMKAAELLVNVVLPAMSRNYKDNDATGEQVRAHLSALSIEDNFELAIGLLMLSPLVDTVYRNVFHVCGDLMGVEVPDDER